MYISVTKPTAKTPRLIAVRGTSQVEGFHPSLHASLSASNLGVRLANCILRELRYRYNTDRGVDNRGDRDLFTYEHRRIESIKALCHRLATPDPYPEWALTPVDFRCTESFDVPEGFDLTPFGARLDVQRQVVEEGEEPVCDEGSPFVDASSAGEPDTTLMIWCLMIWCSVAEEVCIWRSLGVVLAAASDKPFGERLFCSSFVHLHSGLFELCVSAFCSLQDAESCSFETWVIRFGLPCRSVSSWPSS